MAYQGKGYDKSMASGLDDRRHGVELDSLEQMLRTQQEAIEAVARLEAAVDRIGATVATDAYPPPKVAEKAEAVGETKGTLNTVSTLLLGGLAGVFIGLGAMLLKNPPGIVQDKKIAADSAWQDTLRQPSFYVLWIMSDN